jgi:hypothetical protein
MHRGAKRWVSVAVTEGQDHNVAQRDVDTISRRLRSSWSTEKLRKTLAAHLNQHGNPSSVAQAVALIQGSSLFSAIMQARDR